MNELIALENNLSTERQEVIQQADKIAVKDVPSRDSALNFLRACMTLKDRITGFFDPHVKRAHEAHKALTRVRTDAAAPIDAAIGIIKNKIHVFEREQQRLADEARRKAEAEQRRLEAEREKQARKLEKKGQEVAATTLRQAPLAPIPVIAEPVKASGTHIQKRWKAEVTDLAALVKAAAKDPALLCYLTPDLQTIEKVARATEGQTSLPGVRFFQEDVFAVRR